VPKPNRPKVFCFFFPKKKAFLPLALARARYLGSDKKNQKTFASPGRAYPVRPRPKGRGQIGQTFFGLFFKKRAAAFAAGLGLIADL
jgi:hypothetical protein